MMNDFLSTVDNIWIGFTDRLPDFLATLLVGLIAVEVTIIVAGWLLNLTTLSKGLKQVLYAMLRAFLWVVLAMVLLQTLGLDDVFLAVAGSGVVIAIFLAPSLTPLFTDALGGLHLTSDKSFQPGAKVRVGEHGTEGTILSIGLRKTRVEGQDGQLHVIPNAAIDKTEWVVLRPVKRSPRRASKLRRVRSTTKPR